jgi:hypothetical protein
MVRLTAQSRSSETSLHIDVVALIDGKLKCRFFKHRASSRLRLDSAHWSTRRWDLEKHNLL